MEWLLPSSDDSLSQIAHENALSVCANYLRYENIYDYLHRMEENVICTRSVNITFGEYSLLLDKKCDVDGVVMELKELKAVKFPVFYLNILPRGEASIIPMYSILKKHLNLRNYSNHSLFALTKCNGLQLFSSYGWQINIVFLPEQNIPTVVPIPNGFQCKKLAYQYFINFKEAFQSRLLKLTPRQKTKDTFKKNSLFNVSKWRILLKDQSFIMGLLDETLSAIPAPRHYCSSIFAFRFGERDEQTVDVEKDFHIDLVSELTTHIAITFKSASENMHLFWAREGIQRLVGFRGSLCPSMSFRECCNFQTNLDGRAIDIGIQLKNICKFPDNLRFLQLYADTPHMYCNTKHPVSGIIATCNLLHPKSTSRLDRLAEEYMSVCHENGLKLEECIPVRLEQVVALDEIPEKINPNDYFHEDRVRALMETHPLVVPFKERILYSRLELSFLSVLKDIAEHIFLKLKSLKETYQGLGKMLPSWEAYQYELCNEIFWRGKLNCKSDSILARNLGPGDGRNNRALTCLSGFMCLDSCTECALEENIPPPLHHWTLKETQKERICRLFSFGDFLSCNDPVLGSRTLLLLIEEMKCCRDENSVIPTLLADLRKVSKPSWSTCVMSVTAEHLCDDLSKVEVFKYPMTFGRALHMIKNEERDVKAILLAGLCELHLNFFPSYRKRNGFGWNNFQISKIFYEDALADENDFNVNLLTTNIIDELEKEDLVFRSRLVNSSSEFPWVWETCHRLRGMELKKQDLLHILAFVSCVCLVQNGYYVKFKSLLAYLDKMPLSQRDLQELKVLSVFHLRGPLAKTVYRIYEDIPHSFPTATERLKVASDNEDTDDVNIEPEMEDPVEEDDCASKEQVDLVPVRHVPARVHVPWNAVEMRILRDTIKDIKEPKKVMYSRYQRCCQEKGIPDRTYNAFAAAVQREIKRCNKN